MTFLSKDNHPPKTGKHRHHHLVGKRLRKATAFRIALYCFFIMLACVIGLTEVSEEESVNAIAKAADAIGLLAFGILALQFILASRMPWIERPFGLDRVIRFHRTMGVTAGMLLVIHPVLMALSGEPDLLTKLPAPWPIQVGRTAVLLLFATVFVSLRRTALRIPYERWRFWHNAAALAVLILAFVHSFFVEGGIHTPLGRIFWLILVTLSFSAWGYRHLREWHQHHAGRYVVARVVEEANKTWSLVLRPERGHRIPPHFPGQFAFIRTLEGHGAGEEHPFTIASAPEEDDLVFTIRDSGDFTSRIHAMKPGTPVRVQGPFGRFSADLYPEERELVFIAGGVGITPFLSMLRSMRHTGDWRPVKLLHACRTESDLLMRDELAKMEQETGQEFHFVHLLSAPTSSWRGPCGHVNKEFLQTHLAGSLDDKGFYVCGPPGLMDSVEKNLREMGASKHRIHMERFAL